jgi:hypothetical protein
MPVTRKISVGFGLLLALATTASAQTAKPVSSGGGSATIYFMRPMPVLGWDNRPDVRLDGKRVVELPVGSYFAVKTARGAHKIEVQGGGLDGGTDMQLQVEPGKSYFVEIGPRGQPAPGAQLIGRLISGNSLSTQQQGRGFFGVYAFYMLDAEEGRARLAKLKKIGR